MQQGSVERRRGTRVHLEAPLHIRRIGTHEPNPKEHRTKNIGMAGVYFETESGGDYRVNDLFMTSVAIPESQRRQFPFTRLAGHGRVVRVSELSVNDGKSKRYGIAMEYGNDLTALTAIPSRG